MTKSRIAVTALSVAVAIAAIVFVILPPKHFDYGANELERSLADKTDFTDAWCVRSTVRSRLDRWNCETENDPGSGPSGVVIVLVDRNECWRIIYQKPRYSDHDAPLPRGCI